MKVCFLGPRWVKSNTNHAGQKIFLGSLQEIAANISDIFFKNKHKKSIVLLCKSNNHIIKLKKLFR